MGRAGAVAWLLAASAPAAAESPMTRQQIRFASGHVVVAADATVERYDLVVSGAPGHCDPRLRVEERDNRLSVVRDNGDCRDELIVTFRFNPAWAEELELTMKLGQIDLAASLVESARRIDARVSVGDIVGRAGVSRSWLVGARYRVDRPQAGPVIRAELHSGQISLM